MSNRVVYVTPTHERHVFLERCIKYYEQFELSAIVVDSSVAPYQGAVPSSVTYIHTPGKTFNDKLQILCDIVDKAYIVFMADDDFLIPTSVNKGIQFLDKNPIYSSVQGKHISFNEFKKGRDIRYIETDLHSHNLDIKSESLQNRVGSLFGCYMNTFYSLQRAKVWKFFIKAILNNWLMDDAKEHEFAFLEIVQMITTMFFGGHRIMDEYWIVREELPFSKTSLIDIDLFECELPEMMGNMHHTFCREFDINEDEVKGAMSLAVENYKCWGAKNADMQSQLNSRVVNMNKAIGKGISDTDFIMTLIEHYRPSIVEYSKEVFGLGVDYVSAYGVAWLRDIGRKIEEIEEQEERIVLFGAGEHTSAVLDISTIDRMTVAVTDNDESKWGKSFFGVPCIEPSRIMEFAKAVLISSKNYEKEIYADLKKAYGDQLNVYTLYNQMEVCD